MNFPPVSPTELEVLAAVQGNWNLEIDVVAYFPAGFGAHHWQGIRQGTPIAFITLDAAPEEYVRDRLESAYAAAFELGDAGFPNIVAPVRSDSGEFLIAISDSYLSFSPWVEGRTPTQLEAAEPSHLDQTVQTLNRLHSSPQPPSLPVWRPHFDEDFTAYLAKLTSTSWKNGPLGDSARRMIRSSLDHIGGLATRFQVLSELALGRKSTWVPTHGEPHFANQLYLSTGRRLASLRLNAMWWGYRNPRGRYSIRIPE